MATVSPLVFHFYQEKPLRRCGHPGLAAVPGAQNLPELFRGHFGLWEVKAQPPPKVKAPSVTIYLDDSESQILSPDSFYVLPDYPTDPYLS